MSKRTGAVHREDQKNSVGRLLFVVLAVLLQISWFYLVLVRLVDNYITFSIAFRYRKANQCFYQDDLGCLYYGYADFRLGTLFFGLRNQFPKHDEKAL